MKSCRLCFSKGEYLNIFSENGANLRIPQIISDHFKCEVSETDLLPKCICNDCWHLTETFHKFYKSVKFAQTKYLSTFVKTEQNNLDVKLCNDQEHKSLEDFQKPAFVECQPIITANVSEAQKYETNICDSIDNFALQNDPGIDRSQSKNTEDDDDDDASGNENSTEDTTNKIVDRKCSVNTRLPMRKYRTKQETKTKKDHLEQLIAEHSHRFDMTCDECTVHFESFQDARRHYSSAHNNPSGYIKCCCVKLRQRCDIVKHINFHLNPNEYKCNLCSKTYKTHQAFYAHMKQHTASKTKRRKEHFVCEVCNKILTSDVGHRRHVKAHEKNEGENILYTEFMRENFDMNCDHCPIRLESFFDARAHYKSVHHITDGYIKCCNMKFNKLWAVNDHIDFHLNPDSFKCKVCGKLLRTKANMRRHMDGHERTNERPFKCDICGKRSRYKHTIVTHILANHVEAEPKFKCEFCQKRFPLDHLLKNHVYTVHTEHPSNICEICGKSFRVKATLNKHMLSHIDKTERLDKRTQCKYCGELLLTKAGIYYHEKIHTTGPQKCNQCDAELPNQLALLAHIRAYHRELKYKCNYCDKAFEIPYKLKFHMESHTRDKSYPCSYCPMVFKIRSSRDGHHRRTHPDDHKIVQKVKVNLSDRLE